MKKLIPIIVLLIVSCGSSEYATLKWEDGHTERYIPAEGEIDFIHNNPVEDGVEV